LTGALLLLPLRAMASGCRTVTGFRARTICSQDDRA
jgi:hypothetical protein